MTQTWQNELNMKFDRKIVTWQLDVIPSMIGVPNVNFSFLPTIDHLYEIAIKFTLLWQLIITFQFYPQIKFFNI